MPRLSFPPTFKRGCASFSFSEPSLLICPVLLFFCLWITVHSIGHTIPVPVTKWRVGWHLWCSKWCASLCGFAWPFREGQNGVHEGQISTMLCHASDHSSLSNRLLTLLCPQTTFHHLLSLSPTRTVDLLCNILAVNHLTRLYSLLPTTRMHGLQTSQQIGQLLSSSMLFMAAQQWQNGVQRNAPISSVPWCTHDITMADTNFMNQMTATQMAAMVVAETIGGQ